MNFLLITFLLTLVFRVYSDGHASCQAWAEAGECETNPDYMLENCIESCVEVQRRRRVDDMAIESLYDIIEEDIDGDEIDFDSFRGSIVYIVNVASQCGYTAENYEMFRSLSKYRSAGLEIVIAPCNQFGGQEPGDATTISHYAESQDYEGIILGKRDVNGPKTRPLFAYLKRVTGKGNINWNFDGKFLCDRSGICKVPGPHVEDEILALIAQKDL